jgi:hypothetical protein
MRTNWTSRKSNVFHGFVEQEGEGFVVGITPWEEDIPDDTVVEIRDETFEEVTAWANEQVFEAVQLGTVQVRFYTAAHRFELDVTESCIW